MEELLIEETSHGRRVPPNKPLKLSIGRGRPLAA
jgi:hypothetical protein